MIGPMFEKVYSGCIFYRIENGKAIAETGRWLRERIQAGERVAWIRDVVVM